MMIQQDQVIERVDVKFFFQRIWFEIFVLPRKIARFEKANPSKKVCYTTRRLYEERGVRYKLYWQEK